MQWLAAGLWLNTSDRVAEEVPREAVKITQRGMDRRRSSRGSIWQSPFVSLCSSVSHTPTKVLTPRRIKSHVFITNCYGHSSSMYINSFGLFNTAFVWILIRIYSFRLPARIDCLALTLLPDLWLAHIYPAGPNTWTSQCLRIVGTLSCELLLTRRNSNWTYLTTSSLSTIS